MSPEDEFKSLCSESPENKRKIEDSFKEKTKEKAAAWEKLLGKAVFLEFKMKHILEKRGFYRQFENKGYDKILKKLKDEFGEKNCKKLEEAREYRNGLVHSDYEKVINLLGYSYFKSEMERILNKYKTKKQKKNKTKEQEKEVSFCNLLKSFKALGKKMETSYRNGSVNHSDKDHEEVINLLEQLPKNENSKITLWFKNVGHFEDYSIQFQYKILTKKKFNDKLSLMAKLNEVFDKATSELNNLQKK